MRQLLLSMLLGVTLAASVFGQSGFSLNPQRDIAFALLATSSVAAGRLIEPTRSTPQAEASINRFDRLFIQPYHPRLDDLGTIGSATGLIVPGIPVLLNPDERSDMITYGVMYLEAFALTTGVKDLVKACVPRWRPYTYRDSRVEYDHDAENSFPSGHTAYAFMGASFLTTTLATDRVDPRIAVPLRVASYLLAGTTAVLRVASGEHFVTDVLAGAAIGTLCGWLVPQLHRAPTQR